MNSKLNSKRKIGGFDNLDSFLIVILCLSCFILGVAWGMIEEKKVAIKNNVAHYEVNPTNGNTSFVWNTNK